MSPYWDMTLSALSDLMKRLSPAQTSLLLDPDKAVFPKHALSKLPAVALYRRDAFGTGRFIHAKAVIAQTASADHVLMGSANCTVSALGTEGFAGDNEEVCLYRRLPGGSLLPALDLAEVLADDQRIDPASLEDPVLEETLPFEELAAQTPGKFECRVDVLTWRPAKAINPETCIIELLNQNGVLLPCVLSPLAVDTDKRRYQIGETEEPSAFARLLFPNGRRSAPAIITLIDFDTRDSFAQNRERVAPAR